MWNKEIKGRKLTPGEILFLGILMMFIGLLHAILLSRGFTEFHYEALITVSLWFLTGLILIFMRKRYKEKYFPDRRFSKPVSPDGSPLEDNSEELRKQISEETQQKPVYSRMHYYVSAVTMLVISVFYAVFKIIFSANYADSKMFLLIVPSFFIGLSVIVTLKIFGEKKENLKLKLFLAIAYIVSVLIVTSIAVLYFMGNDTVSYFTIALTVIVSAYFVYKMAILSITKNDEQENP